MQVWHSDLYQVICLQEAASVQVNTASFYQEARWLFDVLGHSEVCRMNNPSTEMGSCPAETRHRSSTSWWQRGGQHNMQDCSWLMRKEMKCLSLNMKGVQSAMLLYLLDVWEADFGWSNLLCQPLLCSQSPLIDIFKRRFLTSRNVGIKHYKAGKLA